MVILVEKYVRGEILVFDVGVFNYVPTATSTTYHLLSH
jgi:hypothetical protein